MSSTQKLNSLRAAYEKTLKTYQSLNKEIKESQGLENGTLYINGHFHLHTSRELANKISLEQSLPEFDVTKLI